jgi:predicted transcriptional regulator
MTTTEKARIDQLVLTQIWHVEENIYDLSEKLGLTDSEARSSLNRLMKAGKVKRRWEEFDREGLGFWKNKYGRIMPHWHRVYGRVK